MKKVYFFKKLLKKLNFKAYYKRVQEKSLLLHKASILTIYCDTILPQNRIDLLNDE